MRGTGKYIWQQESWPFFIWDAEALLRPLAGARYVQGRFLRLMEQLGFDLQQEAHLRTVTRDVVKSSAIEGEKLDEAGVRSSLARHLGLLDAGLRPSDAKTEGVVEMMLDATSRASEKLTAKRLWRWQAGLFAGDDSDLHRIRAGAWRDDAAAPMQVVSGPVGRRRIHYEAPPAKRIPVEMKAFLSWFNAPAKEEGLLRAGLAHFWFVTLHPFDDVNGRIARAVCDMALARDEKTDRRFYSFSSQVQRERAQYYDALETAQKGSLDITGWMLWFIGCFQRALDTAEGELDEVLARADFWRRYAREAFNERQKNVLNRFLTHFERKLTAKRWASLAKCSPDTAQRDVADLVARGVLIKNPGGSKNTSYALAP